MRIYNPANGIKILYELKPKKVLSLNADAKIKQANMTTHHTELRISFNFMFLKSILYFFTKKYQYMKGKKIYNINRGINKSPARLRE